VGTKLGGVRSGALAVAIAMILLGGCSSSPAAGPGPEPPGAGGPASFWTRSRLLDTQPFRGGRQLVPSPGQTPNSHTPVVALRVGALFVRAGSTDHFCTASVVASPAENLLITAAHCINGGNGSGYEQDIVFIPGYRDGDAPLGIWTTKRLLVAPQWAKSADPNLDVGFVTLQSHDGQNIQQVLGGGSRLAIDSGYRYLVRVTGYPDSANAPITCLNYTSRQSATQLEFNCAGYTRGTSGSAWVTHFDTRSRTGTIVGVIGGYEQGGDTPSVSYSALLGSDIHQLYEQAIADGTASSQG
jgi:V8-like Glu-specific endopeptidase